MSSEEVTITDPGEHNTRLYADIKTMASIPKDYEMLLPYVEDALAILNYITYPTHLRPEKLEIEGQLSPVGISTQLAVLHFIVDVLDYQGIGGNDAYRNRTAPSAEEITKEILQRAKKVKA